MNKLSFIALLLIHNPLMLIFVSLFLLFLKFPFLVAAISDAKVGQVTFRLDFK